MENVGVAGVGEPERLVPNDFRLAVAAELISGTGEVLGKAVVLSPSLAVTTSTVATSARDTAATAQKLSSANSQVAFGALGLVFPQFASSSRLPAAIQAIDDELRFGVLTFSGQPPMPVSANMLGTGELPRDGDECSVVYADDPQRAFFRISGQLENTPDQEWFYLDLRTLPTDRSQLTGAPVFFESRLIGILVGGPSRSISGGFIIGGVSVRGMGLSKVTPAVRALLPWIDDEPGKKGPSTPARKSEKHEASPPFAQNAQGTAPGTVLSVRLEVNPSSLRRLVFGLEKLLNNDGTFEWKLHFDLQERSDASGALLSLLRLDVDINDENHPLAEATARYGLDEAQRAQAFVAGETAKALLAHEATQEEAERDAQLVIAVRSRAQASAASPEASAALPRTNKSSAASGTASDSDSRRSPLPEDVDGLAEKRADGSHPVSAKDAEMGQPTGWSDAAFLGRLHEMARGTLEEAEGIRQASGHNRMRMEHLVAALWRGWYGLFRKSGISEPDQLNKIFAKAGVAPLVFEAESVRLGALPPRVGDVQEAFVAAAKMADERGEESIWDRDLLNGVFSIEENRVIRTLAEAGVTRKRVRRGSGATEEAETEDVDGLARGELEDAHPVSTKNAETKAAGQPAASGDSDAELWVRMSGSARRVIERAVGLLQQTRPGKSDKLHMEYLIWGLFDSWRAFFADAKVDGEELRRIIRQTAGTAIPGDYAAAKLEKLPEMSKHVRKALIEAAEYARTRHSAQIWRTDLLYGAMSVADCRMIQALTNRGLSRENVYPNAAEDEDAALGPAGRTTASGSAQAAPTPKVASDLWSEKDALGYEGYARTIAGLITHPETVPPLTIGIKAPWGAGKTSLMKRVQYLLDGRAELSEENRSGARQQGQAPQMTLRRLRSELKEIARDEQGTSAAWRSLKASLWRMLGKTDRAVRLPVPSNVEGARYGLPPRVTVWFNAWKYQTSEQIWAGMAHCIISQVTARMVPLDRELFWLRLHARRINTDEVRRKVYGVMLRALAPTALMIAVGVAIVVWLSFTVQLLIPHQWSIRVVTSLVGLIGVIWKARDTLGKKAAGTVKELVREPDYEGKMGYLHLVESDIREVLNLVTEASAESRVVSPESKSPPSRSEREKGGATATAEIPLLANAARSGAPPGGSSPKPLVVFVDDLDRCAPNKVAEVVEAINLFLCGDYPNCIFVLGMEPGMVAAALEVANKDVIAKAKEMGLVDGAAPVGWRFMEKIVQMPVMIPPPTKRGRDSYVESLVGSAASVAAPGVGAPTAAAAEVNVPVAKKKEEPKKDEPPKEEEVREFVQRMQGANLAEVEKKSLEVVAAAAPEKRKAAAEAGKRVYAQTFSERDPVIADFVQECADLVDGNPRQIKRYVNVFRFYSTLRYGLRADGLAKAEELPTDKVLAKFVALSIQWPHAMDCLRGRHHVEPDGRGVSRLEFLEQKSLEMNGDDAGADEKWKDIVGGKGMKLESWAEARAFRAFLARGEMLGKSEGHGLW